MGRSVLTLVQEQRIRCSNLVSSFTPEKGVLVLVGLGADPVE